jgi:hypothetical protein
MKGLRFLGISGRMLTGKDTLYNHIAANYPFMRRLALADPLKQAAVMLFGIDPQVKDDYNRRILQELGTAVRQVHPGAWVRLLIKQAPVGLPDITIVVTDVRYPNEAEAIWTLGGEVVRLEPRTWETYLERVQQKYPDTWEQRINHLSETALGGFANEKLFTHIIRSDSPQEMCALFDAWFGGKYPQKMQSDDDTCNDAAPAPKPQPPRAPMTAHGLRYAGEDSLGRGPLYAGKTITRKQPAAGVSVEPGGTFTVNSVGDDVMGVVRDAQGRITHSTATMHFDPPIEVKPGEVLRVTLEHDVRGEDGNKGYYRLSNDFMDWANGKSA